MSENSNQNQIRPLFRIITGALFLFGLYGLYLVASVHYKLIISSGFELIFLFSGALSLMAFIVWVYLSGYVTLNGRLPIKRK
ncbi:hypothetical protein [Thalassotalea crassostreae]|uniref:hypothetical protein n=1 Tax=Thalassotalea crassostreae TaxID=1763536 RepID=UPI0008398324|nr:hypothetical protein [Thalassotalea crassostreae]